MITYESSITVARDPVRTSDFLLDPAHHGEWMGDVRGSRILTDGPIRTGSRIAYTIARGSLTIPLTMTIADYRPGEIVRFHAEPGGPLAWDATFTFAPDGHGGTRITSFGMMGLRGWRRLLEPLMAGEVRSGEAAELVAFKRVLEATDADR